MTNAWQQDESGICDYFLSHVGLPLSKVQAGELVGKEGVRIVRNENKIYLGEVVNRKKHGKGTSNHDSRHFSLS